MLRIVQSWSPIKIESKEFFSTLNALTKSGWPGAAFQAGKRFAELAEIPDDIQIRGGLAIAGPDADVFFRPDGIFFLVSYDIFRQQGGDSELYYRLSSTLRRLRINNGELGLAAGVISIEDGSPDLLPRLEIFIKAVEEAVKSSVDGRKARHLKFQWASIDATDRLEALKQKLTEEGVEPRFTIPVIDPADSNGAQVLADLQSRTLLMELKEATFAREPDILSRRGRKEEDARQVLRTLNEAGLINVQYLLQCRKNSTPLTRLANKKQLENEAVSTLQCAACSRTYNEELLTEGYVISDLGRKLITSSYWMTTWVTNRLTELGIPVDSILWNLEESGEEVDILVTFLGLLWILELKDREFGPGDAHPFRYRHVRYNANKAIIVTTTKVSEEAKRIFRELDPPRRPGVSRAAVASRGDGLPLYIEGLSNATKELRKAIDQASFDSAIQALELPSFMTGFDLSAVVKLKTS